MSNINHCGNQQLHLPLNNCVIPKRKDNSLVDFLLMSTDEVIDKFSKLPGAEIIGEGEEKSVYVPPTRKDAALLVAHSDTVWDSHPIQLRFGQGLFFSSDQCGIGADDRAGCYTVWELRELGHAILIPGGEESGCKGSNHLMGQKKWRDIVAEHQFAIEFDRMNSSDLVFYSVGAPPFIEWCEKQFKGYKRASGTWTDIAVLCDEDLHEKDCLDGMNLSIGYYSQHTPYERIALSELYRSLNIAKSVLSQPDIPAFKHLYTPKKKPEYNNYDWRKSYNENKEYDNYSNNWLNNQSYNNPKPTTTLEMLDSTLCCPYCSALQDESEYKSNKEHCVYCNEPF
jgi:hypothetical protein